MSPLLTERQQNDLHKAMLDYLYSVGFHKTFQQLKEESLMPDYEADMMQKENGLLVKKWTSVIRLQKKIIDLESRLAQALQDNLNLANKPSDAVQRSNVDWLPTMSPPKLVLTGHRANVNTVAFHPLYSVLVSASDDSTMKVWDWETGDLERTIQGHIRRVSDCEFDSKGKHLGLAFLVSSSHDLFIKLWDVDNEYKNIATFRGHEHSVSTARFLPGDDRIVSASRDQTVRIWEVATTSTDHTARIVEIATGITRAEFRDHDNVVENAVFAPQNAVPALSELIGSKTGVQSVPSADSSTTFVVTASREQKIKIWNARSGQCLHTLIGHDGWVHGLVFHPNGKHLLSSADDGSIRIWDLKTGRCVRKIETVRVIIGLGSTNRWRDRGEQYCRRSRGGRQTR